MPSAEVEIGEQEHEQGGGEHGLRAGAPDPVALPFRPEDLAPEAEVDADVGEHRPCQSRRRRKDHRALDDEDDCEKQGQQAGDPDDDPLVEGEARHLVLVGFRFPEIELRQVGRAKLRDIGDRGAGIERQPEHVGIGDIVALGRETLARGDGRNPRRAEIGPDDAGADEAEMRRHDEALDLLVGVVGEREDDPVRPRAGILGAHLDPAHDPVGTRRRRDEQAIALRGIAFDRFGEIDGRRIERNAGRLDRPGRRQIADKRAGDRQQGEKDAKGTQGQVHRTFMAGHRGRPTRMALCRQRPLRNRKAWA